MRETLLALCQLPAMILIRPCRRASLYCSMMVAQRLPMIEPREGGESHATVSPYGRDERHLCPRHSAIASALLYFRQHAAITARRMISALLRDCRCPYRAIISHRLFYAREPMRIFKRQEELITHLSLPRHGEPALLTLSGAIATSCLAGEFATPRTPPASIYV